MNVVARRTGRLLLAGVVMMMLLASCREPEAVLPTATDVSAVEEQPATAVVAESPGTANPTPTATPEAATATVEVPATTAPEEAVAETPEPDEMATEDHEHDEVSEEPEATEGWLLYDDFTDSSTGWPPSQEFGNYFIGYHEPNWYHVQVNEPNEHVSVVLEGQTFADMTIEGELFVEQSLSDISGDFRYGLVLRAAGRQFYAFTVDPQNRSWAVLKSSPTSLETLAEGSEESINGLEAADLLRIDTTGSRFTFAINGNRVAELEDASYAEGELGFFVQTFDAPRIHIHYDTVRVAMPEDPTVLVSDDFRDASSGWPPSQEFGNYFVGYHEPEWYHVQVNEPNEHVPVLLEGQSFEDASVESEMFVETSFSDPSGDFRYGLVLRGAGRQFYAFTIDPRNGTWAVLKSSPTSLETLAEGSEASIQGLQQATADTLRIDSIGPDFQFYINDNLVVELEDGAYGSGEAGFFVQTFDSPRVHIHYDTFTVRQVQPPAPVCIVTARSLHLRPGPGVAYVPVLRVLSMDTRLTPLARSDFLPWIQVQVEETGETGWVYAGEPYAACNFDVNELPGP
jgi:hypothetical protein